MNLLKTKYRIIKNEYGAYIAQRRTWWSPFWVPCFGGQGTKIEYDVAVKVCRNHMYKRYVTEHLQ